MREKPVSEKKIDNYIDFLFAVQGSSGGAPNTSTLSEVAKRYAITSSAPSALISLGIIKKETKSVWHWIADTRPSKKIALEVLDYLLHKNKKTVHFPIPDFAAISQSLERIVERMNYLAIHTERLLKTPKNDIISIDGKSDLFTIEEQRLLIANAIASGVYKSVNVCNHLMTAVSVGNKGSAAISKCSKCGYEPDGMSELHDYMAMNKFIVLATDDLYSRLLGRSKGADVIGVCSECGKDISKHDSYITETESNQMYCLNHAPEECKLKTQ